MYQTHQPIIAKHALSCPDNLALVQQFVILSVQVPLSRVPTDLEIVREEKRDDAIAGILYGWKQQAYWAAHFEREERYFHVCELLERAGMSERERADSLVAYFADLPGFGPVKAGFVAQLACGLSACLDTNNVKRLGLSVRYWHAWDYKKSTLHIKRKKIARYNDTVDRLGGTAALWDSWCQFVAERDKKYTAEEVSQIHVDALQPFWKG